MDARVKIPRNCCLYSVTTWMNRCESTPPAWIVAVPFAKHGFNLAFSAAPV